MRKKTDIDLISDENDADIETTKFEGRHQNYEDDNDGDKEDDDEGDLQSGEKPGSSIRRDSNSGRINEN